MSELIGVTVNGEEREFDGPLTVAGLLERLELPQRGIAVAVDGAVFPRGRWSESVRRGWEIEILTAVQGG
ncbi:sulfur carrier protein ThiS [Rhodococcus spongiicola]|uniref:Sulfur carrier protein ThiS n=1 Tax=Rhodococcus spongiicola TaxID=2487352 RepID=A0A438ASI2_9NOCA|nr:sulfur carrier protein ThiS [Rhodococcus spongiicola]RVW01667.1 sulfur carrier protein ThiS [Rhodococcus spongiicola]